MTFQEKSAWILLLVSAAVGAWYGHQLWQAGGLGAHSQILTAIVVFIVLAIIVHIAAGILSPKGADMTDERDRRIARRGDMIGGGVLNATLLLIIALSLRDQNWLTANVAFFGLLIAEGAKALWQVILYRQES